MLMPTEASGLSLNISAVERDTGLSKDVLRMWERRYGFPKPERDDNGERQYAPADLSKLRAIKRLMDVGMRPGKLMAHSLDELNALADARAVPRRDQLPPAFERDVLSLLQSHDAPGLQAATRPDPVKGPAALVTDQHQAKTRRHRQQQQVAAAGAVLTG